MAIGLSVISTNPAGNETYAMGALIGLLIGSIACMFFSGWLAGFVARPCYRSPNIGGLYGFSAWCLALLITILTASYVGKFITESSHLLANASAVSEMNAHQHDGVYAVTTVAVDSTPAATNHPAKAANAANAVGVGAFILFVMFFVGALSSTIGGYCAGSKNRKDLDERCSL
jgi:hypothetical protein